MTGLFAQTPPSAKKSAAILVHREICGRGSRRHRCRHRLLTPIALVIFVVGRLENIDLSKPVERRNAKASFCVSQQGYSKNLFELSQKFVRIVGVMA
jgi:hypothetical protein